MARHLNKSLYRETAKAAASLDSVRKLVDKGADPNAQFDFRQTPLWKAAYFGHTEIVLFLLESGADPTIVSSDGSGPLHWAAAGGHTEIVEALIDNSADPNEPREHDSGYISTPLCRAIRAGSIDIVKILVANGADVDHRYFDRTMVEFANWEGETEIAEYLRRSRRITQPQADSKSTE